MSLSVAGICGSQNFKPEKVTIAASAHEKSRPLTTVRINDNKKLKSGEQFVDLQRLKDCYAHLRILPNQSYNINEV